VGDIQRFIDGTPGLPNLRARVAKELPPYESLTDSEKKTLLTMTEYAALPQPVDYGMTYKETFHALWVGGDKQFRDELPKTEFREFRYKQGEWVNSKDVWKVTLTVWLALYLLGFAGFVALNPNLPGGGWTLNNARAVQVFFLLMVMPGFFPGWPIVSVIVEGVVESYKKRHPSTGLLAFRQALRLHKLYAAAKGEADEAELRKRSYWAFLDGYAFERATAEVLRKHQFNPRVTPGSADGGVDIEVTRNGLKGVVQCKAHVACVGPHVVRDLYGVIHHCGASFGIIVSRGGFTRGAVEFARDKPILFLDTDDLIAMQGGRDVLAAAFAPRDANTASQQQ
jgi:restriction system protein